MARDFLPRQDVQIVDPSGRTTTPFYVWMQSLERAFGALDVDLAALLEQIEQLKPGQKITITGAQSVIVANVDGTITISLDGDNDSPGGNWYYGTNADGVRGFWPIADGVSGGYSITNAVDYGPYDFKGELDTPDELPYPVVVGDAYLINGDLWVGADDGGDDGAGWENLGPAPTTVVLSLVNDEATPDPTSYYGTDADGDKGWHPVSDAVEAADGELTKAVDGEGVTTFGLPDITPEAGGTLQRYGFDAKGRRVEEEAADTDDLAEGASNLYFTDERAQDAVGAVADDSGDVELHYETSPARRLWAVLSSAVQSALSAAVSALQPGDDVSQLTNDAGYLTDAPSDGDIYGRKNGAWEQITTSGGGTVTSVGLSVPTGFQVSGSPVTTSGTLTVTYDTGYQGYTSAEASKLSGIEAGATVGADWSVNLSNIPANITSWAGIAPSDVVPSTVAPNLPGTNWDTQSKVGFFRAHSSYGGTSPGLSGDYDVIQTFGSNGDGAQLAFYSGLQAFWRVQDAGPGTWFPWNEFWHTGNLADSGWTSISVGSGWSANNLARRRFGTHVKLRGSIVNTSGVRAPGTIVLTLPAGYRPSTPTMFLVPTLVSGAGDYRRVAVGDNGDIALPDGLPGGVTFWLDGISFYVD